MRRGNAGNFVIGFSLGAAAALLFAPQSGRKTRSLVLRAAADGRDTVEGYSKTAQDAVLGFVEQSRNYVTRQQRGVGEAVKRGAQVFRAH